MNRGQAELRVTETQVRERAMRLSLLNLLQSIHKERNLQRERERENVSVTPATPVPYRETAAKQPGRVGRTAGG